METSMAKVIKEGHLSLLDVKDCEFKPTKYWVELLTTPQEHVYQLCLYYDTKGPKVPFKLVHLKWDTYCGSESGVFGKGGTREERYWALVVRSGTLLFREGRGHRKRPGSLDIMEEWDNAVKKCMKDQGRWMCEAVSCPDPPLPDSFVTILTEFSLCFTSLMGPDGVARSHGLWDIAHVDVEEPNYQNVAREEGLHFIKLVTGHPNKRKGVYILKLAPQARMELVTKLRIFQARHGTPRHRPEGRGNVRFRPLPSPPTHTSPEPSPRTHTPTAGRDLDISGPSSHSPPRRPQKPGSGTHVPGTNPARCPTPPSPRGPSNSSEPPFRQRVKENRPLPPPPNEASPRRHVQFNKSISVPETECPPPVPGRRSLSVPNDRHRPSPRTPSPIHEDVMPMSRKGTDPMHPSTCPTTVGSVPCQPVVHIVVDECKDVAADVVENSANKTKVSRDKPALPKKKSPRRKEEHRYQNVTPDFTPLHASQPRTINGNPAEEDNPYYSVVPAEEDDGICQDFDTSDVQRSEDTHVYLNTPKLATNVKRSGSMPLLQNKSEAALWEYYNVPDKGSQPPYENPGRRIRRCPPPPTVTPDDTKKKPVPAPRYHGSRQELTSEGYYREHPCAQPCEEGCHDTKKKDVMSVILDRNWEDDSLGLPTEKWEKLLLLLCVPSRTQSDWRMLASKLDLTSVDVSLLESVRENYRELPARYVFRYWQRHGPIPYTRPEVQRVLTELERLDLAGMFDDYCTFSIGPLS